MTQKPDLAAKTPVLLFEDNHLLVAIKSPGVLSQSDGSNVPDMLTLLKAYLKEKYQKPGQVYLGLVHRLDRPVGGVMVFAKTSKAAARLSRQIRDHQMEKIYLTVVDGVPDKPEGLWQDTLLKDKKTNQVRIDQTNEGKKAWLSYKTLQTAVKDEVFQIKTIKNQSAVGLSVFDQPFISLLSVRLGSGRGHQIRVQLASRGLPILGDRKYHPDFVKAAKKNNSRLVKKDYNRTAGKNQALYFSDLAEFEKLATDSKKILLQTIGTVCLWSVSLGFYHPVSQKWLNFTAWPPDIIPWRAFNKPDLSILTDWHCH